MSTSVRGQRGDIAETGVSQTAHHLAQDLDEGAELKRQRAGEAKMVSR
jgi:hypothetical protein